MVAVITASRDRRDSWLVFFTVRRSTLLFPIYPALDPSIRSVYAHRNREKKKGKGGRDAGLDVGVRRAVSSVGLGCARECLQDLELLRPDQGRQLAARKDGQRVAQVLLVLLDAATRKNIGTCVSMSVYTVAASFDTRTAGSRGPRLAMVRSELAILRDAPVASDPWAPTRLRSSSAMCARRCVDCRAPPPPVNRWR